MSPLKNVQIGFDLGNVLRLLAARYPTIHSVVLELIQNMIDEDATRGTIHIDLKRRELKALDNGTGVNEEEFERVLQSIGRTRKIPRRAKLLSGLERMGQFGIGIIAPIGKCEVYRFLSRSAKRRKPKTRIVEFVFDQVSISEESTGISRRLRADIDRSKPWWNTMVHLRKISRQRSISQINLGRLISDIVDKFGVAMRASKLDLQIKLTDENGMVTEEKVEPPEFQGEMLDKVVLRGKKCGEVTLELWQLPKPKPKTRVRLLFSIAGDAFQVPWRDFSHTTAGLIDDLVVQVLNTGIFEGRITVTKCKLRPERDGFKVNDALVDFLLLLLEWAEKTGQKWLDRLDAMKRDTRHQDAGKRSLNVVDTLLRTHPALFEPALELLKRAAITDDHTPTGRGKDSKQSSASPKRPAGKGRQSPEGERGRRGENTAQVHVSAGGPRGKIRTEVKGQHGFTLLMEPLPGEIQRCVTDTDRGTITINVRHPDFAQCEARETTLTRYIELIVFWELSLLSVPEMSRDAIEVMADRFLQAMVFDIMADKLAGRQTMRHGLKKQP